MPSATGRMSLLKTLAGSSIIATGDIIANRIAVQEMAKQQEAIRPLINLSSIYRYSVNFAALSAAVLKPDNDYAVGAFAAAHNNALHAVYNDLIFLGVVPPEIPAGTTTNAGELAGITRNVRKNRH